MKFALIFLLIPSLLFGQTITGITGDLDTGATVTISGSGFGAKAAAAPLMWDDLSHYTGLSNYDECPAGGDNPWPYDSVYTPNPYYFTDVDSVRVAGRPLYGATNDGALFGGYDYDLDDDSIFTFNYWIWFNQLPEIPAVGHVTKLVRCWSWEGVPYHGLNLFFDSTQSQTYRYYDDGFIPAEEWMHFEVVVHNSSGMTTDMETTTAYYDVYGNGQKLHPTQPLPGDPANGGDASNLHRFGFDVRYDTDWQDDTIFRWGDIHIDEGLSKVLITDASSYVWDNLTPTHWEIQPVTSWTDTSIEVTVNGGSFSEGASVYVYVIDADGDISNASPVILGESGGGEIPFTAPSDLAVTGGN